MDDRLKHKIVAAKEHFERREFEHTEPLLLQILEKNDRLADIHNMLGIVRHERGDFDGAKEAFEHAVSLNPKYTEAILNLVVTCNDLGQYDEGRRIFEAMKASVGPSITGEVTDSFALGKIANMHADVAQAYAQIGRIDDAIAEIQKGIALRPTFADLHAKLGGLERDRGDLSAAHEAYERACSVNPAYTHARIQLGVTLFMLDRKAEAAEAFRTALENEPGHKVAAMYLRLVEGRLVDGRAP